MIGLEVVFSGLITGAVVPDVVASVVLTDVTVLVVSGCILVVPLEVTENDVVAGELLLVLSISTVMDTDVEVVSSDVDVVAVVEVVPVVNLVILEEDVRADEVVFRSPVVCGEVSR